MPTSDRALLVALSTLAMALSTHALAETRPKPMQVALDKLTTEALYCTAYFGFAQEAVRRRPAAKAANTQKLVTRLGQLADQSLNLAITTGRRAELTPEQVDARQAAVFGDVRKITKNSIANLPVLVAQYDTTCKALIVKPEARLQALFRKEFD